MERTAPLIHDMLRPNKKFPSVWCPGCGNGIVLGCLLRAIKAQGIDHNKVALVSGIGCSGRMPVYADFNTLHTTHGRALAFATGLKLARPDLHVIVIMGDGDSLAIGGNHFIHTCRRNLSMTAIVVNNKIYGMTGGQCSPTTPVDSVATTATYGNIDQPFDISHLAAVAGAAFVGRSTVFHVRELENIISQGLNKKGFALIEAISNCHTYFGRMNRIGQAPDMLKWMKDNTAPVLMDPEKRKDKVTRGVFVDKETIGFLQHYEQLVEKAIKNKELLKQWKQKREHKDDEAEEQAG
ncbi:MAG: 2-oxoacid:ferredoxin oxidoreductase subunit beta [Firmicutes bacterium]|nr:2-oxoacid:ferredoxin oxidoreductase subunit beta [Bacillota bacterium]